MCILEPKPQPRRPGHNHIHRPVGDDAEVFSAGLVSALGRALGSTFGSGLAATLGAEVGVAAGVAWGFDSGLGSGLGCCRRLVHHILWCR